MVPAVFLGFRVDHEVLEAVVKESSPSSVHPQSPRVIDALPEHAFDRCRLRLVIGAFDVFGKLLEMAALAYRWR